MVPRGSLHSHTMPCHAMPYTHTGPGASPYTRTDPRGPFARFPDWAEMGIPRVSVGPVPYPCSQHRAYYFISIHSTSQVLNMLLVGNYLGCLVLMQQVLQNLEFCCMLLCITQALSYACSCIFLHSVFGFSMVQSLTFIVPNFMLFDFIHSKVFLLRYVSQKDHKTCFKK